MISSKTAPQMQAVKDWSVERAVALLQRPLFEPLADPQSPRDERHLKLLMIFFDELEAVQASASFCVVCNCLVVERSPSRESLGYRSYRRSFWAGLALGCKSLAFARRLALFEEFAGRLQETKLRVCADGCPSCPLHRPGLLVETASDSHVCVSLSLSQLLESRGIRRDDSPVYTGSGRWPVEREPVFDAQQVADIVAMVCQPRSDLRSDHKSDQVNRDEQRRGLGPLRGRNVLQLDERRLLQYLGETGMAEFVDWVFNVFDRIADDSSEILSPKQSVFRDAYLLSAAKRLSTFDVQESLRQTDALLASGTDRLPKLASLVDLQTLKQLQSPEEQQAKLIEAIHRDENMQYEMLESMSSDQKHFYFFLRQLVPDLGIMDGCPCCKKGLFSQLDALQRSTKSKKPKLKHRK